MESKHKKRRSRAKGIAETYIHIKDTPESLTKSEARSYLQKNIQIWAEENFKNEVIIKISVEDGSLIVRVLVGGLALANLIGIYGSFRSGIDYLVKDSRNFSDTVIEHFTHDEDISDQSIIRAERRLGVPGKIQRFYKTLDKLNSDDYSHDQRQDIIEYLKEELISIVELLEAPEDRELFLAEVPDRLTSQLHYPLPAPIQGSITLESAIEDGDNSFIALNPELPAPQIPPLPAPYYGATTQITNRNENDD